MALAATATWEVRGTGSDLNGGMFNQSGTSAGTDYSQQDAAQLTLADVVTNGTTTVTSATGGFTAAMVRNGINIASTIYEITAYTNTNTITIDRNAGAASGQAASVGGALQSLNKLQGAFVASNTAWLKGTTANPVTVTGNVTFASGQGGIPGTVMPSRITGYETTRGDNGYAVIRPTGAGYTISNAARGMEFSNLFLDGAANSWATALENTALYVNVVHCKINRFTVAGISITTGGAESAVGFCEVYGGITGATTGIAVGSAVFVVANCTVRDNACNGITATANGPAFHHNTCVRNTVGITIHRTSTVINNTCHANTSHGIAWTNSGVWSEGTEIRNNLLTSNGGYGLLDGGTPNPLRDGNGYWNNTSGTRSTTAPTGAYNVSPYVHAWDAILTGDPYTNAATDDYTLNNTAGAGAACKGVNRGWVAGKSPLYRQDIGAHQTMSSSSSSGVGSIFDPGVFG